ncbi:hypothetical protein L1987_79109 [Smallanthus sonchifolius]|uniref:Uncharacterized protein n=1 Tax=Smallanthus sonchifolius TaxID=185202 RepID=A0ACB8ZJ04_9ASTR|nr:hypothetical protein L1987_79109 [Smallanthus sonchifolius]
MYGFMFPVIVLFAVGDFQTAVDCVLSQIRFLQPTIQSMACLNKQMFSFGLWIRSRLDGTKCDQKLQVEFVEGKPIPAELRNEDTALRQEIDFEDEQTAVPRSTINDEYANATEGDPKILLTTSHGPSAPLKQVVKELKVVFHNFQLMNRGGQVAIKPSW